MASEETEGHTRNVTGTPIGDPASIDSEDKAAESVRNQFCRADGRKARKAKA